MRTKFLLPLLLAPVVLVASLAHAGFEVVSYVLTIGSLSLNVGEEGSVAMEVTNIDGPLGAWTIDITYNPDILATIDCVPFENSACDLERRDNIVRVTGASATGLSTDTTLATITFQCASVGASSLSLSVVVGGIPEDIVDVQTEDGTITCHEAADPTATEEAGPTATEVVAPTSTPLPSLPEAGIGSGRGGGTLTWVAAAFVGVGLAAITGFATLRLRGLRP